MSEERRINPVSRVVLCEDALTNQDSGLRLMGHALEVLTASVTVSVAAYALVDEQREACTIGPVVMKVADPRLGDPVALCRRYVESYAALDPFVAALRWRPEARVVSGADLDKRAPAGYLAELGAGPRVWLVFRDAEAIIAAIMLSRSTGDPDFAAQELAVLKDSHALLEAAHTAALS